MIAVLESVSLDKYIPESPANSEQGDMSPCRSPSTPKHLRYRQAGGTKCASTHTYTHIIHHKLHITSRHVLLFLHMFSYIVIWLLVPTVTSGENSRCTMSPASAFAIATAAAGHSSSQGELKQGMPCFWYLHNDNYK